MKQRIISAIVALAICVPLIYFGGIYFKILLLIISALGMRELLKINDAPKGMKIISFICFLFMIYSNLEHQQFSDLIDINILMFIFLVFGCSSLLYHKSYTTDKMFKLLGETIFLSLAFSLFAVVRNMSLEYFIYLFSVTIFTDTFAQVVGMIIGKHKLTPISPNKTWEGFIGGAILGILLSVIVYMIIVDPSVLVFRLIIVSTVLSIIGQLGDLFFSQIKRNHNIKDFSNIMPGHGGILDRLDSIIFVMIAFTFLSTFL